MLLLLTNCSELMANSVTELLQKIPKEHREDLNHLFTLIFLEQDGAYTIFGDKPLSLTGAFILPTWQTTLSRKGGCMGHLWKIWQNYQHLFQFKKYIMTSEISKIGPSDRTAFHIFVINKKAFINTVIKHLALFEYVLKKRIDPKEFLEDIASDRTSVWNSIDHNEFLLGILLGYGEHNASIFKKRKHHFLSDSVLKSIQSKPASFEENNHPMMFVKPVQFVSDWEHSKTIALQEKYRRLRGEISAIYAKGDFLEITLSKLTEE
jgi:hypothetical protein